MLGHAVESHPQLGETLVPLSGLGVKIFFVLSGFLITRLLLDELDAHGRLDFLAFYRRRVARLMPVFYLYVAVGIAALLLRDKPIPWAAVMSSLLYVTNYYQAFTGAQTHMVSHCWSLAVEEQFYMLWPLLAAWLVARQSNLARVLTLIVLAVWCWRVFLLLGVHVSIDYLYRALDTRADELAVGCLTSVLMRSSEWRARLAAAACLPGVAPVLVLLVYASSQMGSQSAQFKYGFGYMVEPLMIGLLIVWTLMASNRPGWIAGLLRNRLIEHVGQVSYCMYLFHGMIMHSTQHIVEGLTGSFWVGLAASFATVIVFASASFRWFETPMRRLIVGK
jgi:peptidoglycan/LPS O-acetylase OafA/YrhL